MYATAPASLACVLVLCGVPTPAAAAEPDPCAQVVALLAAGRPAEAAALVDTPRSASPDTPDARRRAADLRCAALVHLDARRDAEGERALRDAREAYAALGDASGLGLVWRDLGALSWRLGRQAETTTAYLEAASAFASAGRVHDRAGALRSSTYGAGYPTPDARYRARIEALTLIHGVADHEPSHRYVRGALLHDLGDRAFSTGAYADADLVYEAADTLLSADAENRRAYSLLLTSRARLERAQGHAGRAVTLYERVAALQRDTRYDLGRGQTLSALSVALRHLGRYTEAVSALEESLAIAGRAGPPWRAAVARLQLAGARLDAGDARGAQADLARYLADPARLELGPGYRVGEVALLLAAGQPTEARRVADHVVQATLEEQGMREVLARAYVARAQVHLHEGATGLARADLAAASTTWEGLRAGLTPTDVVRQGFADSTVSGFYALYVDTLAQAGAEAESLAAAELARARAFVDLLAQRALTTTAASLAPGEADEATPRVSVEEIERRLLAAASAGHGTGAPSSPAPALHGFDAQVEQARQVVPLSVPEMQAMATAEKAVVAVYWVGRERSFVWMVPPDGPLRLHAIPVGSRTLGRLVAASVGAQGAASLRRLHRLLVAPFDARLAAGARLVIVPHGVLNRLSFATLIDGRGRYLIERVSVRYAPSMTSLQQLQAAARLPAPDRTAVLVGAPALAPSRDGRPTLPPLPGSRREVARAATDLRGQGVQTSVLTGRDASEAAVRSALLDAPVHLLHVAAHGVVSDEDPMASYIALAGHGPTPEDDGRLTTSEVYGLRLDADLVILSGCRTADGPLSGDGIAGLSRAFFAAGTRSVLASLWDLPDTTTAQVLPAFYEAWRSSGADKAEALQQAQRALIRRLRAGRVSVATKAGPLTLAEHPSLWGGLVVIGAR